MAKRYSYWSRKDGSRWRSVTELKKIKGIAKLQPSKRTKSRKILPKGKKGYWRKVKEIKIERWKGSLQALVSVHYQVSIDRKWHQFVLDSQQYMANTKEELHQKIIEDAENIFSMWTDNDETFVLLSTRIDKIFGDSPELPTNWEQV